MKALAIVLIGIALSLPAAAQKRYEEQTNRPGDRASDPAMNRPADAPVSRDEMRQDARNAALTGKVKAALAGDVGLKTLRINVDSAGNVVTLKGAVDSEDTKRRAEQVAKQVEGVASVNNQLTVRTPR
jgi:osmotically-inducible protein OsmY